MAGARCRSWRGEPSAAAARPAPPPKAGEARLGEGVPLKPEQQPAADRIRLGETHGYRVAEGKLSAGAAPDEAVLPRIVVVIVGGQRRYRNQTVGAALRQADKEAERRHAGDARLVDRADGSAEEGRP